MPRESWTCVIIVPPWRCAPSPRGGAIRAWGGPARSLVMDATLEEAELCERHQPQNREQHDGQRSRVCRIPEPEPDFVDIVEQELGCIVRPAACHHHDVIDDP